MMQRGAPLASTMGVDTRLDGIIDSKRRVILEAFVGEVRVHGLVAPNVAPAEIVRGPDALMSALVDSLRHGRHDGEDTSRVAGEHAEHRARLGYDLRGVLTELGLLRATIVEVASQSGGISADDGERVAEFLHDAMVEAAVRFVGYAPRPR